MEYRIFIWKITLLLHTALHIVQGQDQYPSGFMISDSSAVLDTDTETIEIQAGDTASLNCHVQNQGEIEVVWVYSKDFVFISTNNSVMTDDSRLKVVSPMPGDYNLVITNVTKTDAQFYQCMLQTFPPQFKTVNLVVLSPPKINRNSIQERYMFQTGGHLEVICNVTGDPKPEIMWYAYRTVTPSLEEVKELVSSSKRLSFKNLQAEDGGIYRCEAKNSIGSDMYETFLQHVYEPKLSAPMTIVSVEKGETALLQCEIDSNPAASIGWQRNEQILKSSDKYKVSKFSESETKTIIELTIYYTDMKDMGEYLCIASNANGRNVLKFSVIEPVENVYLTATNGPVTQPSRSLAPTNTHSPILILLSSILLILTL